MYAEKYFSTGYTLQNYKMLSFGFIAEKKAEEPKVIKTFAMQQFSRQFHEKP